MENNLTKLAARITDLRKKRGLTIEKLAYGNELSKGRLSELERGMGNPTLATLSKIAEGLDISLSELFEFE
ncbi:MAG: helix-turn-helix transcriptional regulator [Candidatus Margulisiibacteriota bacterium]|jgi:transcriptional regulator with XRE-family HTH domain